MDVLLEAGEILLFSGAETYRVEETLERMGNALSCPGVQVLATPTGIHVSTGGHFPVTAFRRVEERGTRMDTLVRVNSLSRRLEREPLPLPSVRTELERIRNAKSPWSPGMATVAGAVASGSFALLLGGTGPDILASAVAGIGMTLLGRSVRPKFAGRFLSLAAGGFAAGALGAGAGLMGLKASIVIPSSVIILVPGLQVTNAVRDVLSGDLLSAAALGLEALVLALALAGGVGVGIGLVRLVTPWIG